MDKQCVLKATNIEKYILEKINIKELLPELCLLIYQYYVQSFDYETIDVIGTEYKKIHVGTINLGKCLDDEIKSSTINPVDNIFGWKLEDLNLCYKSDDNGYINLIIYNKLYSKYKILNFKTMDNYKIQIYGSFYLYTGHQYNYPFTSYGGILINMLTGSWMTLPVDHSYYITSNSDSVCVVASGEILSQYDMLHIFTCTYHYTYDINLNLIYTKILPVKYASHGPDIRLNSKNEIALCFVDLNKKYPYSILLKEK